MANWSVTQGVHTSSDITSLEAGEAVINMTISTVVDGVETYYNISADNFIIGGAIETADTVNSTYTFTGGNVDIGVEKVVFTNNGVAGQPDNTVNAAVHLHSDITELSGWPSNQSLFVDIDDRPGKKAEQNRSRLMCIKSIWEYDANSTVTVTDLNAENEQHPITETQLTTSSYQHYGSVPQNITSEVIRLTFTAESGYYYASSPSLVLGMSKEYSQYYSHSYTPVISDGVITSFVMSVFYSPPNEAGLNPDPFDTAVKFCSLSHTARVIYKLNQIEVAPENEITTVMFSEEVPPFGGGHDIIVSGVPGTKYFITLQKKESVDSANPAAKDANYNFTDNQWADELVLYQNSISENGSNTYSVNFPPTTVQVDTRFDLIIAAVDGATLAEGVPQVAGDAIITQLGYDVGTVTPQSSNHTQYASFPTLAISRRKSGEGKQPNSTSTSILAIGGNGGSSSTEVILNTPVPSGIADGQIVTVRNTTGASIVAHGTTVASIRGTILTLSAAAAIPNNTQLRFDNNDRKLEAFDFTITADTGRNIAPIADRDIRVIVSGVDDNVGKIGGGGSGTTVGFTGGTGETATANGIAIGSKMTGEGVVGETDSSGVISTKVTAVDTLNNTITVSHAQLTALTGVSLTFSNSDTFTANSDVYLIDAQVSAVDVNNVKLQGYFKVNRLVATSDISLNIDNIITNTAE